MYLPAVLVYVLGIDQLEPALEDGEGDRNMLPLQPGVGGAVVSDEFVHIFAGICSGYRNVGYVVTHRIKADMRS